jgi:hypothetical protein
MGFMRTSEDILPFVLIDHYLLHGFILKWGSHVHNSMVTHIILKVKSIPWGFVEPSSCGLIPSPGFHWGYVIISTGYRPKLIIDKTSRYC